METRRGRCEQLADGMCCMADARATVLMTIPSSNTRCGYAVGLDALVQDFGPDSDVGWHAYREDYGD